MSTFLDFMEETEDRPVEVKAELVPRPTRTALAKQSEKKVERIRELEDQLFAENMTIIRDVARFRDVGLGETGIPDEWGLDMAEGTKALRVAQAGWMNAKEAPVALKIATQVVTGIIKARATERQAPRTLNMVLVKMEGSPQTFEEIEVE